MCKQKTRKHYMSSRQIDPEKYGLKQNKVIRRCGKKPKVNRRHTRQVY